MNVLVVVNHNINITNRFLDRIKNYQAIDKIVMINFLLSKAEKESIITSSKLITIDCEQDRCYSYVINLGLRYISKKYKNANVIVSSPEVFFKEEVIFNLIEKANQKEIGLIVPTMNVLGQIFQGRKILASKQQFLMRLPFVYRREISKKNNVIYYEAEHYQSEISYVDTSPIFFFVTNEKTMRKIEYFDEQILSNCEEEVLGIKLKRQNYRWAISNNDIVTCISYDNFNDRHQQQRSKKIINSLKYYFFHYLKKDCKDNIYLSLALIIERVRKFVKPIYNFLLQTRHFVIVLGRAFKKAWQQYHFLIPPKMWKKQFKKLVNKLKFETVEPLNIEQYQRWISKNETKVAEYTDFAYKPLISIIIPHYNTEPTYLIECLDSVLNQSYCNFEVCIADDCSTKPESIAILKDYQGIDSRIKVKYRKENGNISNATNTALKMATGEFVAFMDSDDVLSRDALYYVVEVLNQDKKVDIIYSDEDKITVEGKRVFPHFKPDWSPDTLLSCNYICHLTVVRKTLVDEVGGCRIGFEGAQDYDLLLRATEKTKHIHHIPRILYHWKMVPGSTAVTTKNKEYTLDAGKKAIEEALQRRKIKGTVNIVNNTTMYCINYNIKKELVSILIPTRDHVEYLRPCIESIYEKTTYENFEIVLVDHCTIEKEALEYIAEIQERYDNIRVIHKDGEFNYSYLNNEAAKIARGKYFVLLNSDIEIITPNWIEIMMGYASQKHIGCVGIKLLYPDDTVQHAGVVMGISGGASHAFVGSYLDNGDYHGRLAVTYNYSAVTFACVMISRDKYFEINGLNEELKCAFNDVDFCLRILEKGYYNVLVPHVVMYHHESKIRGMDNKGEKLQRFLGEIEYLRSKWEEQIKDDKFYNKNLSRSCAFHLDV